MRPTEAEGTRRTQPAREQGVAVGDGDAVGERSRRTFPWEDAPEGPAAPCPGPAS